MVNAVELGVAYLSLVVETRNVPGQVRKALSGVPEEGRRAGAELGRQMSDAAARAASFDKLKAQAGAAQLASAKATDALGQAQNRQRGTAAQLAVAEQKLTEIRGQAGVKTSQVMAAEERVTRARQADVAAQGQVARAYAASNAAKTQAVGAAGQLAIAQTRQAGAAGQLGAAQLKAGAASNTFGQAQAGAVAATARLGQAQAGAGAQTKLFAASQSTAVQSIAALGARQTQAAAASSLFASSQSKAAQSGTALVTAQGSVAAAFASDAGVKLKSAAATNEFATASGRVPGSLSSIGGALSRVGVDLTGMTTQAGRGREALAALGAPKLRAGIADVGDTIKSSLGIGLAAGIAAATGSAVKLEATFSQTMNLVAASTQAPAAQMTRLNDLAIKLGADTSFSAGEAADAMLELAKSGLSPATIESGALSATLTQAAASGDSLKDTANAIGNALNMFNLQGSQAAEVAAAFAGGANASSAEVSDLTQGLAQVGPGAASMGMSLQETIGILSAFNNAGVKGSDAGTSLKTMLTSLVPSSKQASAAMEYLGLNAADMDRSLAVLAKHGMPGVERNAIAISDAFQGLAESQAGAGASAQKIQKRYEALRMEAGGVQNQFFKANGEMKSAAEIAELLKNATKDLSNEQRVQMMSTIFGADASRAANILAKEGAAGLTKYIEATKNQAAAQDMASARMQGTAGALERLSGAWETFRLQAGQALAPFIQVAADALGDSLGVIGGALQVAVPLITMSVTAWAAYTGTVKAAAAVTMLMEAWTKRAAIAQALLNGTLALNPVGLVVAAVAALAVGLVYAWKNSETFRNVVTGTWDAVRTAASTAWGVIKGVFSGMASAASGIASSVASGFGAVWQGIAKAAAAAWGVIGPVVTSMAAAVRDTLTGAFKALASVAAAVWGGIKTAVSTAWGVLAPIFSTLANVVGTVVKAEFFVLKVAVVAVSGAIILAIQGLWSVTKTVFGAVVSLIKATVIPAWNAMAAAVSAAWATIRDRVFTPLRTWVSATLTAMWNAFRALTSTVWNGISTAIATAWNAILARVFTPLRSWVVATLTPMWNAFRALVAAVWSGITTTVSNAWNAILTRVFTPLRTWVTSTLTSALRTLQSVAATVWSAVTSTISSAWTRVSGTFTALRNGLKGVWDYFGTAVNGIGKTWDGIRDKVTAPVRYVVNNIIRDKLVAAWNAVASKLSLPAFSFAGFARGGWTGPGSRLQPAGVVHADEFVIKKSSRRRIERERPGLLDAMNRTGQVPGYAGGGRVLGLGLPGYATGGAVTNWDARTASGLRMWAAWMRTLIAGKFGIRDIGGYRPVDQFPDHPSGRALDIMVYSNRALGDSVASWLMANWRPANLNYLIWKQRSWNPQRGTWNLMPNRGSITANHFDHVHALFNPGGGNPSGLGGKLTPEMIAALQAGGGGAGISMPNPAAEAAKALVNPLFSGARSLIDGIAGKFGTSAWIDIVKAGAKMPVDQMQKWLTSKIDSVFPALTVGGSGAANEGGTQVSAPGTGVQRWSAVATQALRMTGQPTSLLPTLLRRMQQESSGNPNAINLWDSNAKRGDPSKGLMQVIGSTFRRYAMPGHNTNIYDPLSNILASIRYAVARYGSLAAAYNRAGGYADGGLVAPVKLFDGGGMLERGDIALHAARRPDRVLTDRQWNAVERYLPVRDAESTSAWWREPAGVVIHGDVFGDPARFARQITTRMRDELVLADLAGV